MASKERLYEVWMLYCTKVNTHTHTHTHIHTYIHTHTHTRKRSHMHTTKEMSLGEVMDSVMSFPSLAKRSFSHDLPCYIMGSAYFFSGRLVKTMWDFEDCADAFSTKVTDCHYVAATFSI